MKNELIKIKKDNKSTSKVKFDTSVVYNSKTSSVHKVTDKNILENITLKTWYKVIPGFRSGYIWKRVVASIWYFILIIGIFAPSENSFLMDLTMGLFLLSLTILYTNFLNIKEYTPLLKKQEIGFKILGYIVYTFILVMIFGFILEMVKLL